MLIAFALTHAFALFSLGDRHLENFLLDTYDGSLIGIDFGAAFGQGVLLGVPELMPFRYTRQFQHCMKPLETEGNHHNITQHISTKHNITSLQSNHNMRQSVMKVICGC